MNKKILSMSAAVSLVFWACTTDNSTAPIPSPIAESSSSQGLSSAEIVQGNCSSSQVNAVSSSTIERGDVTLPTDITCSVQKVSDNAVILDFTNALSENMKMKITLVGTDVEMESITTYPSNTPKSVIEDMCEESKEGSITLNATVTCEGNTISVKYKDSANGQKIDDVVESSNRLCEVMKMTADMMSSSSMQVSSSSAIVLPKSSSSASTPSNTEKGKATCVISKDTDEAFNMTIVAPDSVKMTVDATYKNKVFTLSAIAEFDPKVPQSIIDQECAKTKAEAAEDFDGAVVTCNGNVITENFSTTSTTNAIPLLAPTLVMECEKIQETGVIPEDDEE